MRCLRGLAKAEAQSRVSCCSSGSGLCAPAKETYHRQTEAGGKEKPLPWGSSWPMKCSLPSLLPACWNAGLGGEEREGGGQEAAEEGGGGKPWHPSPRLLSVSALSKPQLKFQDLCSLVFSTKGNHNNQQLEKWVEAAKEEKEKQRKTQQHPWPAVFLSGTPGVAAGSDSDSPTLPKG